VTDVDAPEIGAWAALVILDRGARPERRRPVDRRLLGAGTWSVTESTEDYR
jgi:hypothetical protein